MAIVDIVCAAVLLILGLIGLFKGFIRQIMAMVSGIVALILALFTLKYVYEFLYGLDFVKETITAVGGNINVDWAILKGIADSLGKTVGVMLAELGFALILFILLAIVFGLLIKLLKKLLTMIADLPGINIIDRILGFALGLFWAALILFVVFFVLYLVKDSVSAINEFLTNNVPESSYTNKWLIQNLNTIKDYIVQVFEAIKGAFMGTATALV